ncbi:acyl carrier protein [uncultured Ruminococcus sp.]|uniref:acyl carrier protein n=1 Tax=uncultured Ruminococcus sp. TaxID=165186 RepID=UPI002632329A|nr:acyl carrier protein [uncultured Ruminococcus sp.]
MFEKLSDILRNSIFDDDIVITPESKLDTDLGLSSYDIIELVCEVENEFDIKIPSEELSSLYIVDDILKCIGKLKGEEQ